MRPEIVRVAVGCEHHLTSEHGSAGALHSPSRAASLHAQRPGAAMHGGTRSKRGAHQPAHIAQRIQIAATAVQHRDLIARRTGRPLEAWALHEFYPSAAAR